VVGPSHEKVVQTGEAELEVEELVVDQTSAFLVAELEELLEELATWAQVADELELDEELELLEVVFGQ